MSEYTTEKILKLIERNGGPKGLDLSGEGLIGINLGREAIVAELEKAWERVPDQTPVWYSWWTKGINLSEANLQGAYLWGANLQGANLEHVNLQGAMLAGANLQGANLEHVNLQGAMLAGANLQGANLTHSHLEKVDLSGAKSLKGAYFYNALLDDTRMSRELLGEAIGEELDEDYYRAKEAYLRLKQNFDDWGDYAASAWAYQKERQMEKATKAPWRCRKYYGEEEPFPRSMRGLFGKLWPDLRQYGRLPRWSPLVWWFWLKHMVNWLLDWFVEVLCGYGESVKLVLFWMVVALFGFAAYYWRIGGVWLVEPDGSMVIATSFRHYLIYSAGAFTTTGFARFQAANDWVRMVTAIQAIVGIILAGLLGFVVGNRTRRS